MVGPLTGAASSSTFLDSFAQNTNAVGAVWIASSALLTTYSTTSFLKYEGTHKASDHKNNQKLESGGSWPRPALLTLYRFGGSLCLGLLMHPNLHVVRRIEETINGVKQFCIPAAFLFIANYANSISLNRIGISLTYTTKCAIPIFTVILSSILNGLDSLPPIRALLSLFPIALGIAAASWNSPKFEKVGFLMALISCTAQTALNVSSKRVMSRTGIVGPDAQRAMVAVGLMVSLVMFRLQKPAESSNKTMAKSSETSPPTWLSFMAVCGYHFEYVLSFMFVSLVSPVTYGACDSVRRLSIILSGHFMFKHDSFTSTNIIGIGVALLGALSYAVNNQHHPSP